MYMTTGIQIPAIRTIWFFMPGHCYWNEIITQEYSNFCQYCTPNGLTIENLYNLTLAFINVLSTVKQVPMRDTSPN